MRFRGAVVGAYRTQPSNNQSKLSLPPQPSSVKSLRTERLIRTSLDLELDLQATRTWHSQLTQEISVLKELKEQLEQAKSHGEKELPHWLREDERFRLLLRMLEKRVRAMQEAREAAWSALWDCPMRQGREARAWNRAYNPVTH